MVKRWYKKFFLKLRSQFNTQIDAFQAKGGKNQRRPFIIPSRFGLYFGGGILVLLLLAFTYANQLIYLIAFFFSSFLFIVMHLTNNNIKHLQVENYQIHSTFLDQIPKITITLKNAHESFFIRYLKVTAEDENQKIISEIKPLEQITVTLPLLVKSRGLISFPKITLSTTFPFGIFYSWKRVLWKNHFIVYPARTGDLDFPQNNATEENEFHMRNSQSQKKANDEFMMHKEYSSTDNFKRIDWRVFARKNKLYTKVFSNEETKLIFISIKSYLNEVDNDTFEKNLSQITKWVYDAKKNNYLCAIQFKDQTVNVPETPRDYEMVYEYLALLQNEGTKDGV